MIDLSDKKVLERYLLDKGLIDSAVGFSITYCGGGVSCTVAFVQAGDRAMIVKQALAKLKVKENWQCDPNRMNIEMKSNAVYHRLVPDSAPAVYFYDHDNYVFGREAAPERCTMWKNDLLGGLLDFAVAGKAIRALSAVHNACAGDSQMRIDFGDKAIFHDLRISPYIKFVMEKNRAIVPFAEPIVDALMNSSITLVHGDFSPKNIMVDNRRIYILDFEVAHYGHPAFDLAFFSNHFLLKAVKNRQWAASYLDMLRYMLDIYYAEMAFMDRAELESVYVRLLALLFIARVDGKSPAEYITETNDKDLIRSLSAAILDRKIGSYPEMLALVGDGIARVGNRASPLV
ncbi:MAG: phosphotransferase [Planctomycetota bacterium]|jgi:hypothetical protein|nr:phosphotransferase [Planctomycetota bacterium]